MKNEKYCPHIRIIQSAPGKQFISEISSVQQPNKKSRPSKKAEVLFIKKLRKYRKQQKYLTEDQQSQSSLNIIKSCVEQSDSNEVQQLEHDFKRKLTAQQGKPSLINGRKMVKENQNQLTQKKGDPIVIDIVSESQKKEELEEQKQPNGKE